MIESADVGNRVVTATGLVARSSLEYVSSAFRLYKAHHPFASIVSSSAAPTLSGIRIDEVIEPDLATGWFHLPQAIESGKDIAQVAWTSGTTGTPKGIILTHDNLADTTERLVAVQRLDASVREYVGVPPNYSFGLGRFRVVAAVGGHSFMPPKGFDPAEIGRMLRNGEINALAAVPTLLRVLIDNADLLGTAGRYMRWIEIGSQHMTRTEKENIKAIFPEASITQPFGLTEASRTTFLDISATKGRQLESVGRPIGATEIGLSPEGRIRIRGPHVAREFIDADGISSLVDSDGWLTTNDLGEINDGLLYFCGRADDLINFSGIKLVPDLIEERLRERYASAPRVAVARIDDALRGDGILVATDSPKVSIDELRPVALDVLATFGVVPGDGLRVVCVPELPFTATGKIQRRALAAMLPSEPLPDTSADKSDQPESEVVRTFRHVFPRRNIGRSDSLVSLGGDSLAHVSILSRLDEPPGRLPAEWENRSIAELEASLSSASTAHSATGVWRPISSDMALRALAVTLIVAHHAIGGDLGGGIDVLLLLVGLNLARFQTGRLASPQRWGLVRDIILKLVLPYYAFLALYVVLYKQPIFAADILLVSNFVGRSHNLKVTAFWFIEAYLQALLTLTCAATVPFVRKLIIDRPGYFGALFLAFSLLLKLVCILLCHHSSLLGRTPDQFLYIVALGWCIHEAKTTPARLALATIAFVILLVDQSRVGGLWSGFDGRWHTSALFVTTLILLYRPTVRLPQFLRAAVISVATASLVIYMAHPLLIEVLTPVFRHPRLVRPHTRTLSLFLMTMIIIVVAIGLNKLLATVLRRAPRFGNLGHIAGLMR